MAPSVVRLHKLATIEKPLVRKKLGRLPKADWTRIRATLRQILCL
jgi:mRNA-degrading endonuclease toxin of MazEF toxin-antitoxin module